MKMLFKERMFSWLDCYDIYNECGDVLFTVEGKLSWGHCLHILDRHREHVGTVKEKMFSFLPKFEIYERDVCLGHIAKEFGFLMQEYVVEFKGWQVQGDMFGWDYKVKDQNGKQVAVISKELLQWTDTYQIEVDDSENALYVLMLVLAIDAEKCSNK